MTIKDNPIDTSVDERLMGFVRVFFIRRFKREPEADLVYFNEWAERFETGYPERFMDNKSKYVYKKLQEEGFVL